MSSTAAIILAAGEGKRMNSAKPKVLHEVLFKPMIDWVTDAAQAAGILNICVVAGYKAEQLEAHLDGRFETALQSELLGTGHAVMQAADFLKKYAPEDVVILCGDAPFIDADTIKHSYEEHKKNAGVLTVITAQMKDPFGYGRIVRDEKGNARRIVEQKDATFEEKKITEINSGAYWFKTSALLEALNLLKNDNNQGEYYLTDTVGIINAMGMKAGAFVLPDERKIQGANDRHQLALLNSCARDAVIERLYENGVSIPDISGVIVGPDAAIGRDTTLLPGTIIRGKTTIGEGCVIGPNSFIENCEIANDVVFNASQAYKSKLGRGVTVGPFSHLRPNSVIASNAHIGDFVEIKNSNIGEGTKVPHLTYVGDSDVGKKVNFGCGCVTVNYNGVAKNRTKVGDNAFISCNTNLVAPVEVGEGAYTAAGSTITKNVPAYALAVARARQENKEGWVLRRRHKTNQE